MWPHITRLVEGGESGAVTMLHKITPAHTKLTSYGRMKVKLAVQVILQINNYPRGEKYQPEEISLFSISMPE